MTNKIEAAAKKAGRTVRASRAKKAAIVVDTLAGEIAMLEASILADGVELPMAEQAAEPMAEQAAEPMAEQAAEPMAEQAAEAAPSILATISERIAAEYTAKAAAAANLPSVKARDVSTPANHAAVVAKFGAMPAALADAFAAFTVTREAFERFASTVELHGKNDVRATLASLAGLRPSSSALTKNIEGVLQLVASAGEASSVSIDSVDWLAFGTNKAQQRRFSSAAKGILESVGAARRVGASRLEISTQHAGVQALLTMARQQRIIL